MEIETLKEIKEKLAAEPNDDFLAELGADKRRGVQQLLQAYDKRCRREKAERERFAKMLRWETAVYSKGVEYICGVDEAGRGPLAGPLAVAAVILPREIFISGLNDSKQLSAKKRELLYEEILSKALAISVNLVSVSNIDTFNIYVATKKAMAEVVEHLAIKPQVALLDAMQIEISGIHAIPIVHGDALSASIAAASIIAKVTRDRIMREMAQLYPEYGFAENKGYGSSKHMEALRRCGATRYHRRSFEPIKSMGLSPVEAEDNVLYSPLTDECHYRLQ